MTSRSNNHDQDEFEILLSREDYQELKTYEVKLKDVEQTMKIKEREWEKENQTFKQEITILRKENQLITSQCQKVKAAAQKEYIKCLDIIEKLRISCSIESISNPVNNEPITNFTNKNDRTITNLQIIQTTLQKMTISLSSIILPIQSLITSNKLIHQTLLNQHSKTDQQLEQLHTLCQKILLQKSTLEKQYKFQLTQAKNDLQHQKKNVTSLERQISQLRRQNTELIGKLTKSQIHRISIQKDNDLLQQQNIQLHQQMKELQEDNTECQQHIKILKQSIKIQSRSKQQKHQLSLNKNHSNLTQNNNNRLNSSPNKFQKLSFIKETLVQYSREIKNNLISIGNLSQDQIKEIGISQLKTLIEFIHQLEEDFQ